MDLKLKGHNVLVTGGTKGIGRAIVEILSDEGCNIALCARNADDVNAAVEAISAKGVKVVGQQLDVGMAMPSKRGSRQQEKSSAGSTPMFPTSADQTPRGCRMAVAL